MSCSKMTGRLSAYLDGEVTAVERLEIETHLGECRPCRRQHRQLQRTVEAVRRLETLEAPGFSLHRVRPGATGRTDRAARWERIRSGRLAPPRPLLRPVAFAALALMLVLAVLRTLSPGGGTGTDPMPAEPGFDVTQVPMNLPGQDPAERPEWLQHEIARRVAESRGNGPAVPDDGTAENAGDAPPPEPTQERVAEIRDDGRDLAEPAPERAQEQVAEIRDDGRDLVEPAPERAQEQVAELRNGGGSDRADPPPPDVAAPAAAGEIAALTPDEPSAPPATRGDRTGSTPSPSGPVLPTVAVILPRESPAARPGTEPSPAAPTTATPRTNQRTRTGLRTTLAPEEGPTPAEIATVYKTVARLGAEDAALSIVDPSRPVPETGARLERLEPGADLEALEALPRRDPDPDTGIVPPLLLEHPGPELGERAAEVRRRGLLAPLGLRLTVSPEGDVEALRLVSSSGLGWLDQLVVEAASGWTFLPAEDEAGLPVPASLELVLEFEVAAD
jgi:TonB family protein